MIRMHKEEDIKKLIELENNVLGTSLSEKMYEMALTSEMAYFYVYEENNEILGYISTVFDGEIIEILNFCVRPDMQGKHIGTLLLTNALNELYVKGAHSAILEVRESNVNAINVYLNVGFKKINVRKAYYDNGENALVLQRLFVLGDDIELAYQEEFSKAEFTKEYIKFTDDIQKDKYSNNYYELIDLKAFKKLLKNAHGDFIDFQVKEKNTELFEGFEEEETKLLYTNIYRLDIKTKNIGSVEFVNDSNSAEFYNFMFEDNKRWGVDFARCNAGRYLETFLENPRFKGFVIKEDGKIIGTCHTYIFKDGGKIEDFFLSDAYRRKGYGSVLFKAAVDYLKSEGVKEISLEADEDALELYKRWGFVEVRNNYTYHKELKNNG